MLTPYIDKFEIILSNQCNLQCKYCFVHQEKKVMSLEDVHAACDFINNYPHKSRDCMVALFGGETLLHFELVQECIKLLSKELHVVIYTNAILLDENKLTWLLQFPNISYNFSLDGDRYAHNLSRVYHDGRGSFDDVIKSLQTYSNFYRTPIERVCCKSVIYPSNIMGIMSTMQNIETVTCKLSQCLARDPGVWKMEDMSLYEEQFNTLANYYIKNFDRIQNKMDLFIWQVELMTCSREYSCDAARCAQLTIAPDLNLYPCSYFVSNDKDSILGTVHSGIINVDLCNKLKTAFMPDIEECKNCELYKNRSCLGQCIGAVSAYTHGERFDVVIPEFCEIMKILRKISLRVHKELFSNPKYLKSISAYKRNEK